MIDFVEVLQLIVVTVTSNVHFVNDSINSIIVLNDSIDFMAVSTD